MIQIICDFLGCGTPSDEVAFVVGTLFILYLLSEFMSFIWAMYKAVFKRG